MFWSMKFKNQLMKAMVGLRLFTVIHFSVAKSVAQIAYKDRHDTVRQILEFCSDIFRHEFGYKKNKLNT